MRLKGWTIMEIIVSMIISSIVIAMALSSYSILNKMYVTHVSKTDELYSNSLLLSYLNRDLLRSYTIKSASNSLIYQMDSIDVRYTFNEKNIVRSQEEKKDTFFFDEIQAHFFYQKSKAKQQSLVDEIRLNFNIKEKDFQYTFTKLYDAKTLVKHGH